MLDNRVDYLYHHTVGKRLSEECFVRQKSNTDYDAKMHSHHFERWWEERVLPNLADNSVVIIDNANHSGQTEIPGCQQQPGKVANLRLVNEDSFTICYVERKYVLENVTKIFCENTKKDISVLGLPIGHSNLNPIELIWTQVKSQVARQNNNFKIKDVKKILPLGRYLARFLTGVLVRGQILATPKYLDPQITAPLNIMVLNCHVTHM